MGSPMETPGNLNWNPAAVELPPMPMIPPGEDAMSMTIAAVLPTLTTPLTANVAALQAKETMFSGKLGAAQSAYENADDSGGQAAGPTDQHARTGRSDGAAGGPVRWRRRRRVGHVRSDHAAGHEGCRERRQGRRLAGRRSPGSGRPVGGWPDAGRRWCATAGTARRRVGTCTGTGPRARRSRHPTERGSGAAAACRCCRPR